eukprot:COSAG06_NODE_56053_length_286_cov_1.486631_1_plen_61_part_10
MRALAQAIKSDFSDLIGGLRDEERKACDRVAARATRRAGPQRQNGTMNRRVTPRQAANWVE